ncbi:MAG: TIGR02679 family protein [Candidatus Rokubacteria bacterium 13_1_40CM_68_15]|nr:MAG: TIGR02679 family protein [Candidatus Rokubacteria bacterium 13_1_40CM_68_15]
MIADVARLRQLLGSAELAWLVERARRRMPHGAADGSVTLHEPTPAQREAVDRLLGRRPSRGTSLTVRLSDVEAILRHAQICDSLTEAVEVLTGPMVDMRAQRESVEGSWAELFATEEAGGGSHPAVKAWLDELRTSGILKRLSRNDPSVGRTLLHYAREIERRLPARGMPLAELAATVMGDSHALDLSAPLGTIAVRLAAALGGVETWDGPEARREAWASVGVLCDELSAPVLTLNVRGDGTTVTDSALRLHAAAGEPYRLTTRQLLRDPPAFGPSIAGRTIYVCENPTVVASAANRLGAGSQTVVCLEGQPRTATHLLLSRLVTAGGRLVYHGDFDWAGIHIGNLVMRRYRAAAWRFSSEDYRAARGGRELHGTPVAAMWDPSLEATMIETGRAVHEEQVVDMLLTDLGQTADRDR